MGLLFVALAIVGWGIGDFLIQRSARKFGDWEALFFITLFATVVLLPFVYGRLGELSSFEWLILFGTSVIILVAALFDFDALRVGKISIIEPVYALEVPVTIALTTLIIGERLTWLQLSLIAALLLGIFLVSNKHVGAIHMRTIEKGVWFALIATLGMGTSNFLFGYASRATDPLMINWFTSAFIAAATLVYLLYMRQGRKIIAHLRNNKKLILGVGIADNTAWVAYSASTLFMPIGIATGLSESYIALAAILGIFLGGEKLRWHQRLGLVVSVCAAISLAFLVE